MSDLKMNVNDQTTMKVKKINLQQKYQLFINCYTISSKGIPFNRNILDRLSNLKRIPPKSVQYYL